MRLAIVGTTSAAIDGPVTARWGFGRRAARSMSIEVEWPPSPAGWTAQMTLPTGDYRLHEPHVRLQATGEAATGGTLSGDPLLFRKLAAAIGAPLDTASAAFGAGLRRETADDDAAERGSRKQGFARLVTPWSSDAWELVMVTDANERVNAVELSGQTDSEQARTALFDALRVEFGGPDR